MKKILVLTTIYPSPDLKVTNNTDVVHYFTSEWVKKGVEVVVIHNYPIYLKVFHLIARFFQHSLASKFNTLVTTQYSNKPTNILLDGVKVFRLPLFKPFPRCKMLQKTMLQQVDKISNLLNKMNFYPDIIVAHNFYPHIQMVNLLKSRYYLKCKTAIVVHKQNLRMLDYIPNLKDELKSIELWGYRSLPIKKEFELRVGKNERFFMCYSGIPEDFLRDSVTRDFSKPLSSFVYVGSLIKRKYPNKIIDALSHLNYPFCMEYVGDGVLMKKLKEKATSYGLENCILFHGRLSRSQIPKIIERADCFIMISKDETFGLVYLEAMSSGCITIASRNEGMQGIIEDGINGFLCEAGNDEELYAIINRINALSSEEKKAISDNAIQTAKRFTDTTVADSYLNSLYSL